MRWAFGTPNVERLTEMALRGTLKDFGIADIFQLIGHQGKTGILAVRNRDQEVKIFFKDGSVVRSESSVRQKRDLLGGMLLRAEVLREAQLADALETQKKTLKRLGDILIAQGALDAKTLRAFAKLQTTETIYQLFLWDAGTYEFSQTEIETDDGVELIRSESILMEGFRQVDEWPLIRRRITGYGMTFEKREDLDTLTAAASHAEPVKETDDLDFSDAFGDMGGGGGGGNARLKGIGQNERIVYQLIIADRDVQKIIDLSRLGEFETCKALVALIEAEIILAIPEGHRRPSADATVGGIHAKTGASWLPAVTRGILYLALAGTAGYGAWHLALSQQTSAVTRGLEGYVAADLQVVITHGQLGKLRHVLEVFRAETGDYPAALSDLVDAKLLTPRDIHFPWHQQYYYSKQASGYELLRPFY